MATASRHEAQRELDGFASGLVARAGRDVVVEVAVLIGERQTAFLHGDVTLDDWHDPRVSVRVLQVMIDSNNISSQPQLQQLTFSSINSRSMCLFQKNSSHASRHVTSPLPL